MNHTKLLTPTALLGPLLLCSAMAYGQDSENQASENIAETIVDSDSNQGFSFKAWTEGTFAAESDLDADIGEFQYSELALGLNASKSFDDSKFISIDLRLGFIDFDITPSATSVAGDAASIGSEFDEIYSSALSVLYVDKFNDNDSWFVKGGVIASGENNADLGDSIDWFISGGFTHQYSTDLRIGFGVLVKTQLDDDLLIIPLPQIQYTIDEHWSVGNSDTGVKLNYKSSDTLSYGIEGSYASTTFRLDDSHASAIEGMATHRRIPIAFYTVYKPNDNLVISAKIGAMLAGELEILDTNGDDITAQDIDTGIFGSINLSFTF